MFLLLALNSYLSRIPVGYCSNIFLSACIYFNHFEIFCVYCHSWNPPPLTKEGGGLGPSENWVNWGVRNFLLEKGDKPVKGGWCRNGGVATFLILYSSIIFTVCEGKVRFPLLLFRSSVFRVSHARFSSKFLLY